MARPGGAISDTSVSTLPKAGREAGGPFLHALVTVGITHLKTRGNLRMSVS